MRTLTVVGLAVLILLGTVVPLAAQTDVVGQWVSLQNMPFFAPHAHMLPTGKVLIWPGSTSVSGGDPRLWDPATQAITPLSKPGYNLFCSGHTLLADGRLLVTGGHIQSSVGVPNASIYDPFTNTWTAAPDMNEGRWYPNVTALANGDALVVSGDVDTTVGVNRLPQVYQPSSRTWRDLTSAVLALDLYPMMLLAPNGKVFNAGPTPETRYLDTSGTGAWTVVGNRNFGYRDYGSAVMYDGKVLVVGGGDPPTNTAEIIDLNQSSPAWRTVRAMANARRQHNATLLPDGKVLVTGGTSGPGFDNPDTPVFAAEIWDPDTETWSTMASAIIPRRYHSTALLLPDGRVLTTGGNGFTQTEVYSPPYLFKGARPTITSAPATAGYDRPIAVQTPDGDGIARVTLIRLGSVTHAFNQSQRLNRLTFSVTQGGLQVRTPANENLAPPGYYMLFIVNDQGVPSVGSVLQLDPKAVQDTADPTVSFVTPSDGATVSGPVTVTVDAKDDDRVAGVQFFLDDQPLGPESPQSSITWTTTGTTNGQHKLSAKARDAAGKTATVSITVTVSNDPAQPIAAYSFNQSSGTQVNDISGSGNHGTLVNGPLWVAGHNGGGLSFDGVNDYVNVPSLPHLPQWTISAWVRSTAAPASTNNSGPIHREANFQINWNHANAVFRGAAAVRVGTTWYAATFGPLAANTWYHLAATYDGETLRAYTNGILVTSNTAPSGPAAVEANPFRLGRNALATMFFKGIIDDVRIYNRAIPLSDIQQDMQAPVGGAAAPPPPPPPDTTPPTVALTAPAAGAPVSGPVTVTATANDNVGVAGVQFLLGDQPPGEPIGSEDTTAPYSVTWNTSTLTPGEYVLRARARDAAGNETLSSAVKVTVTEPDTTAPTVALTEPAPTGTPPGPITVAGAVTVSATATDNVGIVGVQFLLDGQALGTERTQATPGSDPPTYSITWTTTGTANGEHQLSARARDAAGNTATSEVVTVNVANEGPRPVVAYSFNEGTQALDSSGSNLHGTLVNGPVFVADGHTGRGLSFDGVNDYVNVPSLPHLPQWTISGWVRSPAAPASVLGSGPIHREANFQINWNHGTAAFRGAAALRVGTTWYAASFGPLAANTWYHLAATYDGEALRAYKNGVLITTNTAPSGPAAAEANPLRLGRNAAAAVFFRGIIDDVRIYNRALNLSDIQRDMQTAVEP